jgi:hypothetical protein
MDLKVGEWYYGSEKGRVLFKLSRQNEFTFLINSTDCSQPSASCFALAHFFFRFGSLLLIHCSRQAVSLPSCPAASGSGDPSSFLYPYPAPACSRPSCGVFRISANGRRHCASPHSIPTAQSRAAPEGARRSRLSHDAQPGVTPCGRLLSSFLTLLSDLRSWSATRGISRSPERTFQGQARVGTTGASAGGRPCTSGAIRRPLQQPGHHGCFQRLKGYCNRGASG